ncbi:DMT family transporter [Candidatus Pelagibacter sp.]|nr:DMT family transporter [Candidatus Pelagibacter sp.]
MINFFKKNSGYFAMLLAVIGFGAGPPFVTLALKEFYIVDLLAVRFFIAFLLMVIFCLIMRVDISIKQVGLKPFLMGLLNPFFSNFIVSCWAFINKSSKWSCNNKYFASYSAICCKNIFKRTN